MGLESAKNVFLSAEERAVVKKPVVQQIELSIREKFLRVQERAQQMKQAFDSDYLSNVFKNIAYKKVLNQRLHRTITVGKGVSGRPLPGESQSAPAIPGKEDARAQ